MERINTRKGTQSKFSVQSVMITFIFLSKCQRPIDNSNDFYFLPCREKAHENEFCREK